jgi:hypothetical protein
MVARAEIGCAGAPLLRLWRRGDRTDRGRHHNRERAGDKGCPKQALHDELLALNQTTNITGGNLAVSRRLFKSKQARNEAGLCDIRAELSQLPATPVTMMVVTMMMVPAMPPMMAMMPPMHFRRRQLGVLLNRRRGAGIAERQRVGALGRRCERKHCANGGEPHHFRELHECSPWVGCHVCAESLAATLHAI